MDDKIDFKILTPKKWEQLCNDLLLYINPKIKPIDGSGGDRGIDCFEGKLTGGDLSIYQHKFFLNRLEKTQRRQILNSLDTASKKNKNLKEWILLIPIDFTPKELEWFEEKLVNKNPNLKIGCWGYTKMTHEINKYPKLMDAYFYNNLQTIADKMNRQIKFITPNPLHNAIEVTNYLDQLTMDPRINIKYNSETKEKNVVYSPNSGIPLKFKVKLNDKTNDKLKQIIDNNPMDNSIVFTEEEIVGIDVGDQNVKEIISTFDKITEAKFMYTERVQKKPEWNCNLEILDEIYFEDILLISNSKEQYILIRNSSFEMKIKIDPTNKILDFDSVDIQFNLNQELSKVMYLLNFIKLISETDFKLIDRETNKAILEFSNINIKEIKQIEQTQYLIDRLLIIEKYIGRPIIFKDLEKTEIDNILLVSDIIENKTHNCQVEKLNFSVNKDLAESLIKDSLDKPIENLCFSHICVTVKLFDFEIDLGNLRYLMPPMYIINKSEILSQISENKESIVFSLAPVDKESEIIVDKLEVK